MRTILMLAMLLIVPLLTIACAPPPPCAEGEPQIELVTVPPLNSFNYDKVYGNVCGVDASSTSVVVYIQVGQWWVKPTQAQPLTTIGPFGSFSCDVTTGGSTDLLATEVCAYLVSANYKPRLNIPPAEGEYIAKSCVER